jgi:hypothetical protein
MLDVHLQDDLMLPSRDASAASTGGKMDGQASRINRTSANRGRVEPETWP